VAFNPAQSPPPVKTPIFMFLGRREKRVRL
jgi:hypothetical protein